MGQELLRWSFHGRENAEDERLGACARALRQRKPRMPMVMLTGWGEAVTPEDEQQADWIISKPFELGRISEVASEVARMREVRS